MENGVNIYSFCDAYLETFLAAPDKWPEGHKKKSKDYDKYRGSDLWYKVIPSLLYDYDYTQKDNLFGLDTLYRNMPKKSFVDGKKQELEAILMYYYCCEWNQLEQYWEEYFEKLPYKSQRTGKQERPSTRKKTGLFRSDHLPNSG